MPTLKCIGGPLDGEYHYVYPDAKIGDSYPIRVRKLEFLKTRFDEITEDMSETHNYVVSNKALIPAKL